MDILRTGAVNLSIAVKIVGMVKVRPAIIKKANLFGLAY